MSDLLSLYQSHRGKLSDRWMSYLLQYDRIFSPYRDAPVRLLEIGIQNGGSLELWGKYFPRASVLVGCDIDPACASLTYEDRRVGVVVADACTDEGQSRIEAVSKSYDIVIDDGSHRSGDIVAAFARYFPLIEEGGFFVAEDLHCSYWANFDGGLADPYSSIAFFKRLADIVNKEHWGVGLSAKEFLSGFSLHYGIDFDEGILTQVHSVEFVNSMCILRRRGAQHNILGPRVIVGEVEQVSTDAARYAGTFSQASDQSSNSWSSPRLVDLADGDRLAEHFLEAEERARTLMNQLAETSRRTDQLERDLRRMTEAIAARDHTLRAIASEKAHEDLRVGQDSLAYRAEVSSLQAVLREHQAQIAELVSAQNTPAARLARLTERVARRLFPPQTTRRRLLAKGLVVGDHIHRYGLVQAFKASLVADKQRDQECPTAGDVVAADASALPAEFAGWIRQNEPAPQELERQRGISAAYDAAAPLFSVILPVYRVPPGVMRATLKSLVHQTWQNWEACVAYADGECAENWELLNELSAHEPRFRLMRLDENGGISKNSNAALGMARGEFVALLDHDDELTPWALHDMATHIKGSPDVDFLYSDKDSINAAGTVRKNPLFKPRWSPEMLYSVNYLTHLNVMRRLVVQEVGGWRPETDGAQDWDLFIRVAEKSRVIKHVPGVGYHWRIIEGSTATGIGAKPYAALGQLKTLEDWVNRQGLAATVLPNPDSGFKLVWHVGDRPFCDLVLHGHVTAEKMSSLIGILKLECGEWLSSVTVVAANSTAEQASALSPGDGVSVVACANDSGLAGAIHNAVQKGAAPVVLVLDVSVVSHWVRHSLKELAAWAGMHPDIAFAGPLLLSGPNEVDEAGRVLGDERRTQPLFRGTPLRHWGPFGGPLWYRNVSAVSATAVAFKRSAWNLGKHVQHGWPAALTACCAEAGAGPLRGMVTPHARVHIDESRAQAADPWHDSFSRDPYFHPAFSSAFPLTLKGQG